jgi:hypothetical protein
MKRPKIEDFDQDGLKDFVLIDYKVALEQYCEELTSENEDLANVLNRLSFLNSCEEEGLSSGMPTAQEWAEAFLKANEVLKKYTVTKTKQK